MSTISILQSPTGPTSELNCVDTADDSLQEFFTSSLNSFEEDQDVEGALKYLKLQDLQHRFKDLSVTLMPHVSYSTFIVWLLLIMPASSRCQIHD
jgi:hypothetical protein